MLRRSNFRASAFMTTFRFSLKISEADSIKTADALFIAIIVHVKDDFPEPAEGEASEDLRIFSARE